MKKNRMLLKSAVIFLIILQFTLTKATAQDETKTRTVVVTGEAAIYEGNTAQAKNRALQEAFSAAIRQVMGTYISAQSFTQNFMTIDRSVLNRAKGYIKTYKILEINRTKDILQMKIRAVVSEDGIKDDLTALGILLDAMGNPLVQVQGKDQGLDNSKSIPAIKQHLTDKGFYLVENQQGKNLDIRIQVLGKIVNQTNIESTGMNGAVISLRGKAVQIDTQKVVASRKVVDNGSGFDQKKALSQAYQEAAKQLAPQLIEAITDKWQSALTDGRTLELNVQADNYSSIQQFSRYLGRTFGVKKVDLKCFKSGTANFLVRFTGQTNTLADLLLKAPPDNMSLLVNGFTADAMEIVLQ
jgi:hypothetical protein